MPSRFWAFAFCAVFAPAWAHALPPGPTANPQGRITLNDAELNAANITVEPIGPTAIGATLTTVGRVTYDDLRVARVMSPVSGRVQGVQAQPGDPVAPEAVLATIASPDFATARSDWHKAQVALLAAKKDLARQDALYRRHAAPAQVVQAAWDMYRRARSERDRARGNLHLFGATASGTGQDVYRLRSPIGGVVVSRAVNPGMEVAGQYGGGTSQELFVVADLRQVWVIAEVHEDDLGKIHRGNRVAIHVDALPDSPLVGTLDYVAETLDPISHTVHVRCVVPNMKMQLKPEMFATLAIAATGVQALTVPKASVIHLGDASFVLVQTSPPGASPATFERRHVHLDEAAVEPRVPVTMGLVAGDRVVTAGMATLLAKLE